MGFETIRAKDIVNYIGQMNVLIVDLRAPSDYRKGHIPTAVNIPYKEFDHRKKQLSRDKVLILYCDRGNLSMLAARDLEKEGYQVKSIYGGMSAYRGNVVR
jgi:rhodanese-related sulfurtransferase